MSPIILGSGDFDYLGSSNGELGLPLRPFPRKQDREPCHLIDIVYEMLRLLLLAAGTRNSW